MELDLYLIAKWAHILSSTVLFGTGIGTTFQMVLAWRAQNSQTIAHVSSGVVIADWLFTTPAGVIQPLSGLALIYLQCWSLSEPWLLATYGLYVLAFLCWAPVVHLQIRIRDLTRIAAKSNAPIPTEQPARSASGSPLVGPPSPPLWRSSGL